MKSFIEFIKEEESKSMQYDDLNKDDLFTNVGKFLDSISQSKNFQVNSLKKRGQPGKNVKSMREYRMQLINKTNDTSKEYIDFLKNQLQQNKQIDYLEYNKVSPNSSKFSSFSFKINNQSFDIVVAKGANKGENFEKQTVTDLSSYFGVSKSDRKFAKLIELMNAENKEFASAEIVDVKQRTGSTKKEGVPIEKLGAVIGDIVLVDATNKEWFVSLKDVNGDTFSSYSGAATLFEVSSGALLGNSAGAKFLQAFGVDLNKVQDGFDVRRNFKGFRAKWSTPRPNQTEMKKIFERAWGMNYFYVRKTNNANMWKVFWLDRNYLDSLTNNIVIDEIIYPSKQTKQITIKCHNQKQKYSIEIRNSKAGEYPNDIKFKVK
jgi:hypothetical protein